jgi:hypothetical protein
MHLAHYIALQAQGSTALADAFRDVAEAHLPEVDVPHLCRRLADECDHHAELLAPFADRYGAAAPDPPERLHSTLFSGARDGPLGLLRDLHDLYLMATECDLVWTLLGQAAQGTRDHDLLAVVHSSETDTAIHLRWLRTRMKAAAPQALVVAG